MISELRTIFKNKCSTFDSWVSTFDDFIGNQPRDDNNILEKYKNSPDYCTWEITDDSIITISYQYIHKLCSNGDMYCLQSYTDEKFQSLENYKKLDQSNNLPILESLIVEDNLLYTKFKSPTGDLGYPAPYMILNIMFNSKVVIEDFRKYITTIIDNYVDLIKNCKQCNVPFFSPARTMTSHYYDNSFYFKDSIFFSSNKDLTVEDIADIISSNIDGFRRAKGIISAYQNRVDSNEFTVKMIYNEIENLKNYARTQCLNLKNANL
jgi:hypothetical protein